MARITLTVDVGAQTVQLRVPRRASIPFAGHWVDFYALLAERRPKYVSAMEVARMAGWHNNRGDSVGKQICRHLDALANEHGLPAFIETKGKTRAWRLAHDAVAVVGLPDADSVRAWVEAQLQPAVAADSDAIAIEWMERIVRTLVLTFQGSLERAGEAALSSFAHATTAMQRLCTLLLAARALRRTGMDERCERLLDEAERHLNSLDSQVRRSIDARLKVMRAFLDVGIDRADAKRVTAGLIRTFAGADLHGIGASLNAVGVLANRVGDSKTSLAVLADALPYLAITGDLYTLQGAVFNLAYGLYLREESAANATIVRLLELDCYIRSTLAIGRDSAQAELMLAAVYARQKDFATAQTWLAHGKSVVDALPPTSILEWSYYFEVRAMVEAISPALTTDRLDSVLALASRAKELRLEGGRPTTDLDERIRGWKALRPNLPTTTV